MKKQQQTVNRIYTCYNKECNGQVFYEQGIYDKFKKKCPFCKKNELVLDSGTLNSTMIMDIKKPKTLGSLGEKNYENAQKEGKELGFRKTHIPFWRKNKKIDYGILKNPSKYIETGNI
jgi:hypothetical protein